MRKAKEMGRAAIVLCAATLSCVVQTAEAQTLGYQFGVLQSAGTTLGDDLTITTFVSEQNRLLYLRRLAEVVPVPPDLPEGGNQMVAGDTAEIRVQSLQGIQLITTVTSNMTLDFVGRKFSHGFVLGAQLSQLIPLGVPDAPEGLPEDTTLQLRQRLTTATANASWLGRFAFPRWQFSFGGGYTLGLNGRLGAGQGGGVQAGGGAAGGVQPAAQAGAFAFNGLTHTFIARSQLQLRRRRWDFNAALDYSYAENGIFTLAAGAPGAVNNNATNQGAFVAANLHTFGPNATLRTRIGGRGTLTANLGAVYTKPRIIGDLVTVVNGVTMIVPGPPGFPETLLNSARLELAYVPQRGQAFGVDTTFLLNFRRGADLTGAPLPGSMLSPDTAIYSPRAFYRARLPWEIQLQVAAGVAQALLFQPPFGQVTPAGSSFQTVRSNFEPVAALRLSRFFDPIQATLTGGREIAPGVFGASAVASEFANLAFTHQLAVSREFRLTTNIGFNFNRIKNVGRDLFAVADPDNPVIVAGDNLGFGFAAGIAAPLWRNENLTVDANLGYNFSWIDSDPEGLQDQEVELDCNNLRPGFDCETVRGQLTDLASVVGLEPVQTHVVLFTLRGTWGRGTAQSASGIGGRTLRDELDAFTADPQTGSPLVTATLLTLGADLNSQGELPGDPPRSRRDSRREFRADIKRAGEERERQLTSGAVLGQGNMQQEEKELIDKEKKEQKQREADRQRSFGDWPFAPPSATPSAPEEPDEAAPPPK